MLAGLRGGAARGAAAACALQPGQPFVTAGERRGSVAELLGAGGQGEVHKVMIDGVPLALKWYHPACIKADVTLRDRLRRKEFPKPEYVGRVVELRTRYLVISMRPREWLAAEVVP